MKTLADLHEAIAAAGIPIDGVSNVFGVYAVQFKAGATAEQRAAAESIVAGFDWVGPPPPRARAVLRQAIEALTATERNRLRDALAIEQMLDLAADHPDRAQALFGRLGLVVKIREGGN